MEGPLSGIRVLEVANYIAVPAATTMLADWGADVIKVEVPWGEVYRRSTPKRNGYKSDFPLSAPYEMDNRGKRSLTLDFALPEAVEALGKVAEQVDIIVTNLLPERLEKFGLEPEALMQRRPELIFARMAGYSPYGEMASEPGFDHTAFFAMTGLMDIWREGNSPPAVPRPGVGDHATAMALLSGIMAAVRTRDKTGKGQVVDVDLQHMGLYVNGNDTSQSVATGLEPPGPNRTAPRNPIWNPYRCGDDRWLFLVMLDSGRYWSEFTRAIDRPELRDDERFKDPVARLNNNVALREILDARFGEQTLEEWKQRFADFSIVWAPVQTVLEAVSDPRLEGNGCLLEVEHESHGKFKTIAPPIRLSLHPTPRAAAPELSAHTAEILNEAGVEPETVELLVAMASS